ncbi:hypothetical protein Tco_0814585 [Tanacetum coccineum]
MLAIPRSPIDYNHRTTFASGEKTPKPKYVQKKADYDTSPKQKPVQATKGTRIKSKAKVCKPDKKKQPAKKPKAKGLAVLFEFALTEAEQLKLASKRSKKDFHILHANGSSDRVDTQSKVPDEQHLETTGADEGTGTIPRAPDVPIYESESEKESWDQTEHEEEDVDDRVHTPSDYEFTDDEKLDDEETMDDEVIKELYADVNVNLGNEDTEMTYADQEASEQQNVSQESGFEQVEEDAHVTLTPVLDTQKADEPVQSSSVSSDFTSKLLNLENPSPADNEIASLMETSARHATAVPEITSGFTITIPPPPPFFNPLLQQQTPTSTTTTTNPTMTLPEIPNFASLFKFDQRVSALESEMSEFRQTSQFAEAVSSIPGIVDTYLASKMKEAVDVVVQLQTNKLREEAQAENQEFLNQVDSTMKAIIKEQVQAQVFKIMPKIDKYITESLGAKVLVRSTNQPQTSYTILPQAVSDFVNPVIEKNITGSVEAAVLTRSSSQLTSTDEAAASLFEGFEMKETKINTPLLDQTKGQKEENRVKLLSPPEIQGQSKRSLQAPLKTPPNLNISLPANQNRRKRLMHADELHKFSDGTLNDVRSSLHDIAVEIRIEYMPMRKWSNLDKKRARVIV